MKIKKKTGLMLVATAAVAATGVAAVSFAAWSGSNNTLSAQAATGEAHLFGFTTDQSSANLALGTLVPYDQPSDSIKSGDVIVSVAIPEYVVNADYTITVTSSTALDFYVLVGSQQTALPADYTTDKKAPADWADWKKVDNAANAKFDFTATKGTTVTANTQYISLVLVSGNTSDMGQTNIPFTVTLAEKSA